MLLGILNICFSLVPRYYGLSLLRTLNLRPRVSAITGVDCIANPRPPDQKIRIFIISPKKPFGKLFSKTISQSEAPFLRKIGNFKIDLNPMVEGPMEIMHIRTFSNRSYEKAKSIIYITDICHNRTERELRSLARIS